MIQHHGALFLRGAAARMLHDITDEQEQELNAHTHTRDSSFGMLFAPVIAGLVVLAFIFCMWQMFRVWLLRVCCGRETSTSNDRAIIVHKAQVFDLNSTQRRAVLEAIFSETSKVC
jgi:hypothetical protein